MADTPPLKILSQIALLQLAYYMSATVLIIFTVMVFGQQMHPDLLWSWRTVRGDTTVGWMLGLVWMLNSGITVIAILLLISRSKLVLDFALTLHGLHLLFTSLYTHALPRNLLWWGLQAASAGLMISLGVWSCRWRELQPMSFGGGGGSRTSAGATAEEVAVGADGGQDSNAGDGLGVTYGRGRGRGRGRDGGGDYEMVAIKEGDDHV
ncbi:MAG: Integral membrane protein of the Golgi [Caeruleum heppii]|nr:MAG: Integral membrane protein of the Golgi [Caeruleum heppii]